MSGKTAEIIGDLAGVSRSSVQKFFNGKLISVDNFQLLCGELELDWKEIAESEEIASSITNRKRVAFVIEGSLDDLDPTKLAKLQAMVRSLQQLTGDASMTTVDIEEGSIRLILEGSEEGIEKLKQLFDEGELAEVLGTPVRSVELTKYDIRKREEVREDRLKALLVATIQSQGAFRADLSDSDLSETNLTKADLRGADLRGADLRDADLRGMGFPRDCDRNRTLAFALSLPLARRRIRDLLLATVLATVLAIVLVLVRNRTLVLVLVLALVLALVLVRNRARAFTRARARTFILACRRARHVGNVFDILNLDLDRALVRARDIALDLDLDLDLALDLALNRNQKRINLRSANLTGANLSNVDLSITEIGGAIVENTFFGKGIGLIESERHQLRRRGAIFDESTGDHTTDDRSSITSPVR